MSFWGKIFGTEKALNTAIESVRDGLDSLVYTDEEKAGDAATDRKEARRTVVAWMAATQGQNLARRLLALSITAVWLFQYVVSVGLSVSAVFINTYKSEANEAAALLKSGASDMSGPVMLILAFYFAAPHMGSVATAVLDKFKTKAS